MFLTCGRNIRIGLQDEKGEYGKYLVDQLVHCVGTASRLGCVLGNIIFFAETISGRGADAIVNFAKVVIIESEIEI